MAKQQSILAQKLAMLIYTKNRVAQIGGFVELKDFLSLFPIYFTWELGKSSRGTIFFSSYKWRGALPIKKLSGS